MTGQDIRAWRKQRKLSQAKAAKVLGLRWRTLQGWEQGRAMHRLVQDLLREKLNTNEKG